MQVVGFSKTKFTPKDSDTEIRGYNIFIVEERKNVTGHACERIFVSEYKLDGYTPELKDEVQITYNRYGKIAEVRKI